jgi:4-carboxymuconolactone decarboxylase
VSSEWARWPNRVAPVTEPDEAQAEALSKAPTLPDGTVRNIFSTFAHQPVLLKRFNAFVGTFMRFGTLSAYEREVVVLRVAATSRSRYELGQHLPIARDCGLSDDTVAALLAVPSLDGLADADRLLAEATDAVLADGAVDDALWARLAASYGDAQLVELVTLIGAYRMVADLLNVTGVQLEADLDDEVDRWL